VSGVTAPPRGPLRGRLLTMGRVGLRMLFHDRLKLAGTLLGVVFAVVLADQQAGTFLGVIYKNVMLVERSAADLWILPPGVEVFGPGKDLPASDALAARATAGVRRAEPLLVNTGELQLAGGGAEQVTVVGVRTPSDMGVPWSLVRGDASALRRPATMIFEDGEREVLGGLNLGSVRQLSGRNVVAGGFTWGLVPFGPSYAFADYDLARELFGTPRDQTNYVMVQLEPGADAAAVQRALASRLPQAVVLTREQFTRLIVRHLILKTAIGVTFGTSTLFGLVVGFVIVSLSMFSSVVDNLREFGTLKALGATNLDLMLLLLVQAVTVAVLGSAIGLAAVMEVASLLRNPKLAVLLPPFLTGGTAALMLVLCVLASSLALLRLRKVEPAMVFR
jgi:putative ABC transport system permease protein